MFKSIRGIVKKVSNLGESKMIIRNQQKLKKT